MANKGQSPQRPTIPVAEDPPDEGVQFEELLAGVAGRLSNATDETFDATLIACLRQLAEHLGFDRSSVVLFSQASNRFRISHSWAAEGVPAVEPGAAVDTELPWFTHQIRSGHMVKFSGETDLPEVGPEERAYLKSSGLKSSLSIPLMVEDAVIGSVGFATFRAARQWPHAVVWRLRLVGEVIALAIRRRQLSRGLDAVARNIGELRLRPGEREQGPAQDLRRLAMRLMQAEQDERRRMSGVVHEDVMQLLAYVGMLLGAAGGPEPDKRTAALERSQEVLRQVLSKLRQLVMDLRPTRLSAAGLAEAVRWLAGEVGEAAGVKVEFTAEGPIEPMDDGVRTFVYDAARKLLDNVVTHSGARTVRVNLRRFEDGQIRLTVSDDGVGLSEAPSREVPSCSFGVFTIAEQAELLGGRLEVSGRPGKGTQAVLTVPA